MAFILSIETATKKCSVSIAKDGKHVALKEMYDKKYVHDELLHPFIKQVCNLAGIEFNNLDAIAVSKGPGSYTGLRIGVSASKGLCFALGIPLISTPTLKTLAYRVKVDNDLQTRIVSVLDARRMDVYCAVFDFDYTQIEQTKILTLNKNVFDDILNKGGDVYFIGDGASKCQEVLKHPNAKFILDKHPSAKQMDSLAFKKFKTRDFENLAYFEPYYLRDFIVTPEKTK